ncbi:hypothetical protein BX666DRAFT_1973646 [Dichotomocladium elegans]|nr:hypothetical protein BX666DRAFT_1973646 [Dichotomocladium elegans]
MLAQNPSPQLSLYHLIFESDHPRTAKDDEPLLIDALNPIRRHTFNSLRRYVRAFAALLREEYGIGPGDVITLCSNNDIDYPVVFYGILAAGATVSPILRSSTAESMEYVLALTSPKLAIVHSDTYDAIRNAAVNAGISTRLPFLAIGSCPVPSIPSVFSLIADKLEKPHTVVEADPESIAYIICTSGTTSLPKAVMISHRAGAYRALDMAWVYEGAPSYCFGSNFSASFGVSMSLLSGIYSGTPQYIAATGSLASILETVKKYDVYGTCISPGLFREAINAYDQISFGPCKRVLVGGDQFKIQALQRAKEALDIDIIYLYGSSETAEPFKKDYKIISESFGKFNDNDPEDAVRLVDQNGQDVPPGEIGELLFKSKRLASGYYRNPKATAEKFDKDGYYHTGDLFKMDKDGHYYFMSRAVDGIRAKSKTFSAREVENLCMLFHEGFLDCCVVGVLDEKLGYEVPIAHVLVNKDFDTVGMESRLVDFINKRVSHPELKLRNGITFVNSLPVNKYGAKVDRRALKKIAQEVYSEKYLEDLVI